eukprot:PhF_6_TR25084/c0_g2_i1/m.34428
MDRPSQPPAESNAIAALQAQVTSLQQRVQDLEATKNKDPPQYIQFVGGADGWTNSTGDRFSANSPYMANTGPAAYERAKKDFMAWKASNPTVCVLSERLEIVGLPVAYSGSHAGSCATAIIHVTYSA